MVKTFSSSAPFWWSGILEQTRRASPAVVEFLTIQGTTAYESQFTDTKLGKDDPRHESQGKETLSYEMAQIL